jgi:cytochrome c oxidase cbb3-type subunit II
VKNNFLFFVGLAAALGISWAGIVLGSNAQLGGLAPFYDDTQQASFPGWMAGNAAQGQLVYKSLGCVACHTQQVRRPDFGSDAARGWGDRQSVARDYIYQPYPQIGRSRVGPDLANLADRRPLPLDGDDLLNLLYTGADGMPSYRFLFDERAVGVGAQPSNSALQLVGNLRPKAGWEIVPTPKAVALVAYLLSLKNTYTYPEAAPLPAPKAEGETAAASAPAPAPTAGAALASNAAKPAAAEAGATPSTPSTVSPSPTPTPPITPTPEGNK